MAIQLADGFSTSLWPPHKVQWAAPNLNLQRKSHSQTVGAVRKSNHKHVNSELNGKSVTK